MENEACLAAIRNQYNTLTKTERQIADYILANSSSVVEMSVADLAAASAAAGSAVIRFCKTIGYTGFSQFRITLAMELASRPAPVMPLQTQRARFLTPACVLCRIRSPCWIFPLLRPW